MQKILIAHKSEEFTHVLAAALRERYEVHISHTGPETRSKIDALRPTALVIYLSLPIMTGPDVLNAVNYRPAVIVALTDIVTPPVLQAAADAGADVIFPMPCTIRAIVKHLDALVASKIPLPGP